MKSGDPPRNQRDDSRVTPPDSSPAPAAPALAGDARPSILWIVTTQWRAQASGYAGDPNARTPNLDALAKRSINYIQAVTPHPFGPFARAALLTGMPSPENGVVDYFDPLPGDARTIAHAMERRGYATAWFGKWHLWRRDPAAPLVGEAHARTVVPEAARGGFAFWEGFESGFLLNDPWLHGTRLPEPTRIYGYQSDILCERAAEWIRQQRRPVFCVVSLEPPHPPYGEPAAGVSAPDPGTLILRGNVPRGGEVEARARRELAGYYAHIEATDRAVGRLIEHVGDRCIVVFTSVHGDMHGSHGRFRKGWPHEESVRVPLLVAHPDGREPRQSEAPVSLVDLPALTCRLADRERWTCPRDHAEVSMPSIVALPDQCDRKWGGVRTPDRKQIFGPDGWPWLDFDLRADPLELHNLAPLRHPRREPLS